MGLLLGQLKWALATAFKDRGSSVSPFLPTFVVDLIR